MTTVSFPEHQQARKIIAEAARLQQIAKRSGLEVILFRITRETYATLYRDLDPGAEEIPEPGEGDLLFNVPLRADVPEGEGIIAEVRSRPTPPIVATVDRLVERDD